MRKLHLILMACLLLSACATDDVSNQRSTTTSVKKTPTKKPAGNVNPNANTPAKSRPSASVSARTSAPIDTTVIQHRNRGKAQLLAAVGGGIERDVDDYMAQQAEDLQRVLQSEIEQGEVRVERRASDNALRVSMTFESGFDNLSSVVKPGYLASLNKIVPVLKQYGKTMLTVIGYIEHAGPDAGNQKLAERRAKSVMDYFINQNVDALRLQSYARGDSPVSTDNGGGSDQPMRRVELWIQPVFAQ